MCQKTDKTKNVYIFAHRDTFPSWTGPLRNWSEKDINKIIIRPFLDHGRIIVRLLGGSPLTHGSCGAEYSKTDYSKIIVRN